MTQSEDSSFELADNGNTPTKQLTSAVDLSVSSDEIYQLEPGSRIGRYVIRKRIGAGGFGIVFVGEDVTLGHELAGSQPISIRRALMLMKQVALALSHLHSKGLIHRDRR